MPNYLTSFDKEKMIRKFLFAALFFAVAMFAPAIVHAQSNNLAVTISGSGSVNQGFNRVSPQVGIDADYYADNGVVLSNRFSISSEHKASVGNGFVLADTAFAAKLFGDETFSFGPLAGAEVETYRNSAYQKTAFTPIVGGLAVFNGTGTFVLRGEFLTRTLNVTPKGTGARFTGEYFLPLYKNFGAKGVAQVGFLQYSGRNGRNYAVGAGVYYSF
jgi:hypothetical protein